MRQKKPLLLYCAEPGLLAATAFALRLHGYDVTAIHSHKEAIRMASGTGSQVTCGVLLHAQQGDPAGRLIHCLLASHTHIPLLLVDRVGDLAPVRYADMVLYGRNTSMSCILSALQVLCSRKRSMA